MTNQDYSTLSFLARAVATSPERTPDFVAAARGDVQGVALQLGFSDELNEAVTAIAEAFDRQKQTSPQRLMTLPDVIVMADQLEARPERSIALAGNALRAASRELLLRKRRDLALTPEERELAWSELPAVAAG